MQDNFTAFVRFCLWGGEAVPADEKIYEEMKLHAIAALPAGVMNLLPMPGELRREWQAEIYRMIAANVTYRHIQADLPVHVPYVILKGTSAAMYYPHPQYRTMGDIDIMTRREDYAAACEELKRGGCREITDSLETARGRHRQFVTDEGVIVEVHAQYAHQNDPEKAKLLDDLIISGIREDHVPPEEINGLVLIEHINHHMENGLGLRQIIDWMVYADKCLTDEKWPAFRALAEQTGHEQLALVTTRMCEMYLGLTSRRWCAGADPAVCAKLMEYVLANGNFGRKQGDDSRNSQRFLSSARTLRGMFRFLQDRGMMTWPAAQKHRILRPFAWMHHGFRYLNKGLRRKGTLAKLKAEHEAARERNELFDALGVAREEKGLVHYKNGRYVKL